MRRDRPSLANPEADGAEGDAGAWQVLRSEQRDQPSRLDAARGENLRHRTVLARVYCLDDGPIDHRAAIEGSVQRVFLSNQSLRPGARPTDDSEPLGTVVVDAGDYAFRVRDQAASFRRHVLSDAVKCGALAGIDHADKAHRHLAQAQRYP